MWACTPIIKRVYSKFVDSNKSDEAKTWLNYVYKNDYALGLQCSAETIDDYVEGYYTFDVVADAFELFVDNITDPARSCSKLKKRCVNLARFPWHQLKEQRSELFMRIVGYMSQSEQCDDIFMKVRKLIRPQAQGGSSKQNSKRQLLFKVG